MASKRLILPIALLLTLATSAHADPTAAEKETARTLMNEGRARREKNDAKGALESFRAADALMHVPTTGLEVARSQVALGQLVEAHDTIRQVLRLPKRAREPQPFVEARAQAQALDDDLAARIPAVRVVLQGAPDGATASVQIDDVPLPPEALGMAFKVNPGHHVIRATAGNASGSAEADVNEKEEKLVNVTLQSGPEAEAPAPPPAEEHHAGARPILLYGGIGLAAAGVIVGTVSGVLSLSHAGKVKDTCVDNQCPRASSDDLDAAKSTATISTIGFAVAGAGAALIVVSLLMHDAPESATSARATRVTPWIGPGSAGFRGVF